MRKVAAISITALLGACSQSAREPHGSLERGRQGSPVALYTNGGFESGTLGSWTVTTNSNPGITYPPASITDLNLAGGGTARSFARTGATPESQLPAGMSAASTLKYPKYGTWSGVINETGATQNVNSLTQQMATTAADVDPADGLIHVRFVVAPVLQSPGHANNQQPYYYVLVSNVTQGTTLFSRFNYVNESGVPWQSDSGGSILYTGWQVVDVPGTAGAIAIGDTVQVRVIAAGCSLGGHWGEAYVDAFGAFLPGLSIAAHAPQRANAGSNLSTSYVVTNSGASSANNVTVVAPVPTQTTFVSLTTPPGASCTTPAVGATGNVTCNFGTMNPSSTLTFTMVTAIAAAASGSIPNGSYTVSSTGVSALLGPLVTTIVTSAVNYANLSVTMDDGKGGVAWSQAVQYTIQVSNGGPVTATNATVVDALPAQLTGATWTCAGSGGGTCGSASGSGSINTTVTLPSGASAAYVLSASIIAGSGTSRVTNVVNVATAAGATDPDTTNNRAADTDDIGSVVTVTVQKDATGTGLGSVVSSPAAISCGTACASASAQFATGNLVTLTAIAAPGDTFVGWSGACSGSATTCNLNPATNVTATAKFDAQSFTISASVPGGNGNVSCTSPVLHNQSSTCTVAPAAGYKLSQLTDNGADVTALVASNVYTISSVAANHTVIASFLKDYGTACGAAGECAGGVCVDGVCCTAACAGQCQACDVPGSVGTCATVTSGTPHGARPACTSDGSACGGSCNGSSASACGYPGAATQCRAASCAAGTAVPAGSCNGTGTCPSAATSQCSPYVCGASACKTTCTADLDCVSGDYCDAGGACVPKKADGLSCSAPNQCGNGNCADGVCCNQACGGQCQACNVSGSVGQCVAVAGAPHGARPACATDGSSCGGACDGVNAAVCAYPTAQCRGASCSAGVATASASCNGAGSCPAPATSACSPYACGPTACKTSCSADADCAAADYCNGAGACVPKKADGFACAASNQCSNGSCADGVCCNQACNGQCQACDVPGSVGQCVAVSGAPHGARTACTGSGTCGGTCDGSNVSACAYPTVQCRGASCAAGTATATASCDGAGACPAAVTTACAPFVCGASACKTTCTADTDCVSGDYCDAGGACVPKKADGLSCSASNQCGSGNCADGVCCNQACGGQCQACNVSGSVGQCVAVAGAPHGARPACGTDGSSCGGACDGVTTAACAYPTAQCRGASCSAGVETASASCNGAGSCPAPVTTSCSPYACGPTSCKTSCAADSDCAAADYCNGAGTCVPKKADGVACTASNQCGNGNCADGVCCNQACNGQCQACDVPGSVGQCVAVSGAPHGARTACTGSGTCGGSCDGSNVSACAYPIVQCRGASCTAGTATAGASCDGAGACPAAVTTACAPFVCGASACKTSCTADADCVSGDYCDGTGACVPKKADGLSCSASNQCGNGNCADGVCCNQACGGQCQACDVPGNVGQCVAVNGAPHGPRSACAGSGTCGGSCNGSNPSACAYPTVQCRGASCTSGVATAAAACDGAGSCPSPSITSCNPYACGASACKTSCTADADCGAGDYCDGTGACVPKKGDGVACSASNQCGNGSCADGVCCNQACNGQCQACDVPGSVGQCVAVSGAPHGPRTACTGAGSACGGACDGADPSACAYPDSTTSCRGATCSAGIATAAATCDGAGTCPAAVTTQCDPYVCGANACKTSCASEADCIAGDGCDATGVCVPKTLLGQGCSSSNQCVSGFCIDGYCCDQGCSGQCQACDVAGSEGTCAPVAGDPHGARTACRGSGTTCGGACDGVATAACAYPDATVSCRSGSCSAGSATLAAGCDGTGLCPAPQTQLCNPYLCGATACLGNCARDADCIAGDWCSAGVCVPKLPDAQACGGSSQCASGSCVDGVCCDQACDGQCQACDVPGSVGVCVAVSGDPHGARTACATDGSACGGSCDGAHGLSCGYPTAQCRGPSCGAGVATLPASCDGVGHCPAQQTQSCDPYVCGATACRGDCVLDADCSAGNFCAAGVCTPKLLAGATCGGANQCGSGFCVDSLCCDQACNGQCQACDAPGNAGVCTAVAGAPHGTRQACGSDGTSCGGLCDGANSLACAYPIAQCRGASCSAGIATLAAACDGAGHCPAAQTQACAPYSCGATGCTGNCTTTADCMGSDWCSAGVCVSLLANGASCGAAGQCASGNCVDGLCCDTGCNGQCEACNVTGSAGLCTAVIGDPRGGRPACVTDGSACGGVCDGSSRTACAYPVAASQCRAPSCANGIASSAAACDGAGHCPAPQQTSCNAYVCGPNACKTSCSTDPDCQDNGFCISNVCHSRMDPSVWVVAGAGGCTGAGPASWPLALVALAFALRRRRRMAALAVVLAATGASAQSATFTVDHFQPGAGAFDVLGVRSPETAGHLEWRGSVTTSFARDPLRLIAIGHPDQVRLLHGQSMLHLGASLGLFDRFEVGAVLPVALAQSSEGAPMLGSSVAAPVSGGVGDLRILPKARILSLGGFVLGAAAPFTLPTGRQDAFLGAGAASLTPTILAELQDVGPVRLLANAGVAVRGGRSLGNLQVSSAMTYGLAAEAPFEVRGQRLAALATLSGEVNLRHGGAVERPLELLGGVRWSAMRGIDLMAGGGPGLTDGYGTPRYRLFFTFSFSPAMMSSRRLPPLVPTIVESRPPPAPTLTVVTAGEPIILSRTLELARIEEDHVELLAPVLFARGRDVLLLQSRAVLDAAVSVLLDHPELSLVRVEGHTDGHGRPAYNLTLSRRRAKAVCAYLTKHGIAPERLESDGFGSARPIDSNQTNEGRARNRRVEMLIVRRGAAALPGAGG